MEKNNFKFTALIYKVGINQMVDVPLSITRKMHPDKGIIRVFGTINGAEFHTTLMPFRDSPFRLYVNMLMLDAGKTAGGKRAKFSIRQDFEKTIRHYPMIGSLKKQLVAAQLMDDYNNLTESRRKDILRYLNSVKTEETLQRHIAGVIEKLKKGEKDVRIP